MTVFPKLHHRDVRMSPDCCLKLAFFPTVSVLSDDLLPPGPHLCQAFYGQKLDHIFERRPESASTDWKMEIAEGPQRAVPARFPRSLRKFVEVLAFTVDLDVCCGVWVRWLSFVIPMDQHLSQLVIEIKPILRLVDCEVCTLGVGSQNVPGVKIGSWRFVSQGQRNWFSAQILASNTASNVHPCSLAMRNDGSQSHAISDCSIQKVGDLCGKASCLGLQINQRMAK